MKYALWAAALVLACACGNVASQATDAPGSERVDAPRSEPIDAPVSEPRRDSAPPDAACVATAEILDGKDNDCDGQIDNGFWATMITVPQTTLAAHDPGCANEAAIRANAYDCQLAARHECQARGYTSGFRPAEVDATNVAFTCVADVRVVPAVSYAELQRHHPGCLQTTAFQGECFAAIKRYCESNGFKTGIGPLNADTGASIDLMCTNHAAHVPIAVTQLPGVFKDCTIPPSKPWDFSCFHAYSRYCQMGAGAGAANAWASGWGPVEFDGKTAWMACLSDRPRS